MGNNQSQEFDNYSAEQLLESAVTQGAVSNVDSRNPSKWCANGISNPTRVVSDRTRLDGKVTVRAPRSRSTGTNTQPSIYEASSLYRRKMYAESQPHFKRPLTGQSIAITRPRGQPRTLPPLNAGDRNVARACQQNPGNQIRCASLRPKYAVLQPMAIKQGPSLVTQQWNGNNWTDGGSDTGCESCQTPRDDCSNRGDAIRPLPPLNNLRHLMEKFDSELSTSKVTLKKGMERLTDTELLIGHSCQQQKQLLTKTEESVLSTQTLLAKIHQHIANTHEFCNMLHRIDESLQTFSKAAYTVASWEKWKGDGSLHLTKQ